MEGVGEDSCHKIPPRNCSLQEGVNGEEVCECVSVCGKGEQKLFSRSTLILIHNGCRVSSLTVHSAAAARASWSAAVFDLTLSPTPARHSSAPSCPASGPQQDGFLRSHWSVREATTPAACRHQAVTHTKKKTIKYIISPGSGELVRYRLASWRRLVRT